MFEEPSEPRSESAADPLLRAKEKAAEYRMHAELAAIFEGPRKYDAAVRANLDPELARELQRKFARMEKAKSPESPLLPQPVMRDAAEVLSIPKTQHLSTNDYHIYRRPGEAMIVRWLADEQVDAFYQRFQAHFDVALDDYRAEERQSQGWKQDPKTLAYLDALESLDARMADRYSRDAIRNHRIFILSTLAVDEMDIFHLCDHLMSTSAADVVGEASAPPDEPTEKDRAWFFKLYSVRGIVENVERMCFFVYLQKSDDSW
jgi:hypothetical protein